MKMNANNAHPPRDADTGAHTGTGPKREALGGLLAVTVSGALYPDQFETAVTVEVQ